MSKVSIPKGKSDPSYRYQRPVMVISTYGQGGNIKTKIENIHELAKALAVPAEYPLKFIGYELGSQTDIKNGDFIISGRHMLEKLEELLEKFIKMYVLCPFKKCQLPEISIFIKNTQIRSKCRACATIANLDDKHRLANFIIKSPPTMDNAKMTGVNVSVDETQKTAAPVAKLEIKENIKKLKALTKKLNEATYDDQIDETIKEVISDPVMSTPDCKYFILINGLYNKDIYEVFEAKAKHLKKVIELDAQPKDEVYHHILSAIINLFIDRFAKDKDVAVELLTQIPSILYLLYNEQIISEAFFLKRLRKQDSPYKNPFDNPNSDKVFAEKAEEFLNWLETAPFEGETQTDSQPKKKNDNSIQDL